MARKYYIIIAVIILIVAGAIVYLYFAKKSNKQVAGASGSQSVVDLRPLIAEKLQQLIKEGSDSLYSLSMEKIVPDVVNGELDVLDGALEIDSAVMKKLDSLKKAPDDVFRITFHHLHIDGITIADMLNHGRIDLDSVFIETPVIEAFHNPKPYNRQQRVKDSSATLYAKLMNQVKSIAVKTIFIKEGTFITRDLTNKKNNKVFNYVTMHIADLLIDSTTQYDRDRFLFAKKAEMTCKDYTSRTADSLYLFKIGTLTVQAQQHTMIAENVSLTPRADTALFEKKLPYRKDRYDFHFPKMVFTEVDWWAFANNEHFFCRQADLYRPTLTDYIDRSVEEPTHVKLDNFPSQVLMQLPVKIRVEKMNFHDMDIYFTEYNPISKRSATVYFDKINGSAKNITNMPSAGRFIRFNASCLFMHKVPFHCSASFDLSRYKIGAFSIDVSAAELNSETINKFSEPLGMIKIKSGTMQKGRAHIEGNNFTATGKILLLYDELHITPLKKDDDNDNLKSKTVTSFIANAFMIKNQNPPEGEPPREPELILERKPNEGFVNFVWRVISTGISKSIGVR